MTEHTKKPISRACAEAVGIYPYIELDDWIICWTRRDDTHPQVEHVWRVSREDGTMTEFVPEDMKVLRWTECVGAGKYFYILKQDFLQIGRVDADTLEETVINCVGSYPRHLSLTDRYLYYSTKKEHTMIIRVDLDRLQSAGMDAENEFMNLKEDAWIPQGEEFYGMHDDFTQEVSSYYHIDMNLFKVEKLGEIPFSMEEFWKKSELMKEAFTDICEDYICTINQQSRHGSSTYEVLFLQKEEPPVKRDLCGPHAYVWFQNHQIYTAETNGDGCICRVNPADDTRVIVAKLPDCFARDSFGHITGDRPQVVGRWLNYTEASTGNRKTLELPE